ncbi:MAG: TonB family protein [Acidobacteria bacterium]|nr:MAG: TonB family protein [Acidobacteriota bacterium]
MTCGDLFEDSATDELQSFAWEEAEDRKTIRRAAIAALLVHAVLLSLKLPELAVAADDVTHKPKIFVLQTPRMLPPEPQPEPVRPQRRERKVFVPDPTPDDPEPIWTEQLEPAVELSDSGLVFDFPSAPPPFESDIAIPVGGEVTKPVKIFFPKPQYNELARRAGLEGIVILQAVIDRQGQVGEVEVLKGLPLGLTESAVAAVERWRFEPATLRGKPVRVYFNLTVKFGLE